MTLNLKFTHRIPSSMSISAQSRMRVYIAAGVAITLGASAACDPGSLVKVTDPDILNIADYNTPAGADPLRIGVVARFTTAFDGSSNSYTTVSGTMADEMLASSTHQTNVRVDQRNMVEENDIAGGVYSNLQRARASANNAIQILATTQPEPTYNRGELYMLRGYAEMFLGEGWCPGVPFSSEDGVTQTFGKPQTTDQVFAVAAASFDSAIALADTNTRIRYGAEIGKARALQNLGKFADAAAAVADVPQNYVLYDYHSAAGTSNGVWSAASTGASSYKIMTNEGTNGLPFLAGHDDPRLKWKPGTRTAFNSVFTNLDEQLKFGRYDNGIISTGVEAKLIILENQLQANTQAARDAVYAGLNALRASGPPVVPLMTTGAPQTQDAAVNLLYTERAYWLWLTGHRLADMRRLVRIYKRNAETVYPTGEVPEPFVGTYGNQTAMVIPFEERNNPNFQGCLAGA
jgi:hypothetical protein